MKEAKTLNGLVFASQPFGYGQYLLDSLYFTSKCTNIISVTLPSKVGPMSLAASQARTLISSISSYTMSVKDGFVDLKYILNNITYIYRSGSSDSTSVDSVSLELNVDVSMNDKYGAKKRKSNQVLILHHNLGFY